MGIIPSELCRIKTCRSQLHVHFSGLLLYGIVSLFQGQCGDTGQLGHRCEESAGSLMRTTVGAGVVQVSACEPGAGQTLKMA